MCIVFVILSGSDTELCLPKLSYRGRKLKWYPFELFCTCIPLISIVAANRDEHFDRPTAPLNVYQKGQMPRVYCGRDLSHGGDRDEIRTWLAINEYGIISTVTNCRLVPMIHGSRSRGDLPLRVLPSAPSIMNKERDDAAIVEEMKCIRTECSLYSGFNLLTINTMSNRIFYVGSHHDYIELTNRYIDSKEQAKEQFKVIALSNGTIASNWPKMDKGIKLLKDALTQTSTHFDHNIEEALLGILANDEELKRHCESTTCNEEMERILSPIFIHPTEEIICQESAWNGRLLFGTVSSAIIFVYESSRPQTGQEIKNNHEDAEFIEISWRNRLPGDNWKNYYKQHRTCYSISFN